MSIIALGYPRWKHDDSGGAARDGGGLAAPLPSVNALHCPLRISSHMRRSLQLLSLAIVACLPACVSAQGYPFSQRGTVSQMVAFTRLEIEYGRPTARGRALFGALVPWDSVWHPGADSATTLTVSQAVTFEGRQLPAGAYSLWLIPRVAGPWTLIVSRATGIPHTPYPGVGSDVLRIDVAPDSASRVETLTYMFPQVLRDTAVLRLQWGDVGVSIRVNAPYRPRDVPAR